MWPPDRRLWVPPFCRDVRIYPSSLFLTTFERPCAPGSSPCRFATASRAAQQRPQVMGPSNVLPYLFVTRVELRLAGASLIKRGEARCSSVGDAQLGAAPTTWSRAPLPRRRQRRARGAGALGNRVLCCPPGTGSSWDQRTTPVLPRHHRVERTHCGEPRPVRGFPPPTKPLASRPHTREFPTHCTGASWEAAHHTCSRAIHGS
jgi:hypothetical protein